VAPLRQLSDFLEAEAAETTVFLRLHDNSARMINELQKFMTADESFTQRTIVISRSPLAIYQVKKIASYYSILGFLLIPFFQLRKLKPEIICGLWHETYLSLAILKSSTLITSIYGAIFRNIIAPVIGISVVFLSKDEINM